MSSNLSTLKAAPVSSVSLKTKNPRQTTPQLPRQKFARGALMRGSTAGSSGPKSSTSAAPSSPPPMSPSPGLMQPSGSSGQSASFSPPSDMTDPTTMRAPRTPQSQPAVADPMDAVGTDPYSSSLTDDTGMPSYKKGGLVKSKKRGWGKARG